MSEENKQQLNEAESQSKDVGSRRTEEQLLDLIDKLRIFYHFRITEVYVDEDDAIEECLDLNIEMCETLVAAGRYKFEDMFLTPETLETMRTEAQKIMESF